MKTALVTGGARGIGKAIVENLIKHEYCVLVNYHHSGEEAKKLKEDFKENTIELYQADLSDEKQANKMVAFCLQKFKTIDLLINNSGISQIKPFTDITIEDWNQMMQTNLNSVFYVTKEVVPSMIQKKQGCIINISSIWGITGGSCEVHYSAAKAGMIGFTKALAKELGPSHIRVNCIAPGAIVTEMNSDINQKDWEEFNQNVPLGKRGKPEDIAKCVLWLAEDEFTTGQVISPNGGYVI